MSNQDPSLALRFRGFLPVVVDVETGGFDARNDALLEIAAVMLDIDAQGHLRPATRVHFHVDPFPGANIEQAALDFTGIDPNNPLRGAVAETNALKGVFDPVRKAIKAHNCNRAVLVGHNSFFDLGFINSAVERTGIKRNPFHPFSSFDTATLAGLVYGQTVLAKACQAANIPFNPKDAHSALYDATRTAELFCSMVNRFRDLGGWPPPPADDMPPTLARELD